jgi:SAM-dependent methyltransferase
MEREIYTRMAEVEDRHWWFVSRRAIVESLLNRLALPAKAAILEAGCGTGGNLAMLARHGRVFAMELDDEARGVALKRTEANVEAGRLPDLIPFGSLQFDLVVMTDVLEHLDDDVAALRALRQRMRPGGALLVTVPAAPWLWSQHDVSHHHRRRYSIAQLRTLVSKAGYSVCYLSYYNCLLFPAIAGVRLARRLIRLRGYNHDLSMPPAMLNSMLIRLFSSERHLLARASLPLGVSLVLVARNPVGVSCQRDTFSAT